MKRAFSLALLAIAAVAAHAQQPSAPAPSTASADDLARRAIAALAGNNWEKARYFSFSFNVERDGTTVASFPQRWDRYTGDYRVEGKDQQGMHFLIIMNTNNGKGRAWKEGAEVLGSPLADMLPVGFRRFINDTYWLLMPLKMMDPGVHREYAGVRTGDNGDVYDLVKLSFDPGVGLTSADQYWAWINRKTNMVDQWDMKLQGSKPEDAPLQVKFHDYGKFGGLMISTKREIIGKKQFIHLDDLKVMSEVPKGAFDAPKE